MTDLNAVVWPDIFISCETPIDKWNSVAVLVNIDLSSVSQEISYYKYCADITSQFKGVSAQGVIKV